MPRQNSTRLFAPVDPTARSRPRVSKRAGVGIEHDPAQVSDRAVRALHPASDIKFRGRVHGRLELDRISRGPAEQFPAHQRLAGITDELDREDLDLSLWLLDRPTERPDADF